MPFPDEPLADEVRIVPSRGEWAQEGERLVARLQDLVPEASVVDHIGSTAVPGLAAKDCLDAMVQVPDVGTAGLSALVAVGFRERPEEWNRTESVDGVPFAKRVFAPPVGQRAMNVHVRAYRSSPARYALLFRDFLRADDRARDDWGAFKRRVADEVPDLGGYGRIKAAAQPLLMARAEEWAEATGWQPA